MQTREFVLFIQVYDESHGIAPEADSPTAAYTYVTYGQLDFPTMQNLFILVHGSILMNHS